MAAIAMVGGLRRRRCLGCGGDKLNLRPRLLQAPVIAGSSRNREGATEVQHGTHNQINQPIVANGLAD